MAGAIPPLNFDNIQGDILRGGLPKKTQIFFFFQVLRAQEFRKQLVEFIPQITTISQASKDRDTVDNSKPSLVTVSGVNIAFTHKGLVQIGINDDIGDPAFKSGMLSRAESLGDPGTKPSGGTFSPNWDPAFKQEIHGLILVTGDKRATVDQKLADIKKIFLVEAPNATIKQAKLVYGDVRPGNQKGHEHFGFLDGISEPAVQGVDNKPNRGQETIHQGIVLLGREGDTVQRPSWALDGSLLSFRYLSQLVPEFNKFLKDNPVSGLPKEQGSELLGARLIGRWKSGAPIDLTPEKDDPALGADSTRNNDFSYSALFPNDQATQIRCPFAAHIRKTNPRSDLAGFGGTEIRRIIRSGIPFGPELSPEETEKTKSDRGLLFVAYQSNLGNGFEFIQKAWANAPNFPFPPKAALVPPVVPGVDPIIGQSTDANAFKISGTDPNDPSKTLSVFPQFVVPKGGEYFFTPSIPALKGTFAKA